MKENMKKNTKKNANKKYIMPLMIMLGIGLVVAATFYAVATYTINVNQPISITGAGETGFPSCNAGDTCLSAVPITIKNSDLLDDKSVFVTDNSGDNIVVSYVGKMTFVEKNLVDWTTMTSGNQILDMEYTITGNSFVANVPDGYTLIYYPEIGDFAANVAGILVYGTTDVFPSLPISLDVGDDYCNIGVSTGLPNGFNPNALVCSGAKLWLIPKTFSNVDAVRTEVGTWSTASTFLFETDLMTYTKSTNGEVLVPANSTITVYPAFTPDKYVAGGERIIKVTVA